MSQLKTPACSDEPPADKIQAELEKLVDHLCQLLNAGGKDTVSKLLLRVLH